MRCLPSCQSFHKRVDVVRRTGLIDGDAIIVAVDMRLFRNTSTFAHSTENTELTRWCSNTMEYTRRRQKYSSYLKAKIVVPKVQCTVLDDESVCHNL